MQGSVQAECGHRWKVMQCMQVCTSIEAAELEQTQSESSFSRFFKQSRPAVAPSAAGPQVASV